MQAIAPNLSVMVGELVGARLLAHAGSLLTLAKHPASTVQILGAEKVPRCAARPLAWAPRSRAPSLLQALFRALKTKHDTPKYGLIYHASLVGQAAPKFKGKISRVLAAKTALAVRTDALGDVDGVSIGISARARVENRLSELEGGVTRQISGTGKKQQKYEKTPASARKSYNEAADVVMTPAEKKPKKVRACSPSRRGGC
jgi:nucleolar protein 58